MKKRILKEKTFIKYILLSLLIVILVTNCNQDDTQEVAEFKNLSNLTRKNAIPILEFFDNGNITRREGNNRKAGESLFVK